MQIVVEVERGLLSLDALFVAFGLCGGFIRVGAEAFALVVGAQPENLAGLLLVRALFVA